MKSRTALMVLLVLAAATVASAQDEIELLDGTKMRGTIERVEAGKVVIRTAPDKTMLEVPLNYLTPYQQYKIRALQPKEAEGHVNLMKWCLTNAKWEDRLRTGADAEAKQALSKGVTRDALQTVLQPFNLMLTDKDDLRSPSEMGLVWDDETKEYVTPEELEKREKARLAERAAEMKNKLLIGKPQIYDLVQIEIVRAAKADYSKRKVRFWSHFHAQDEDFGRVQADGLLLTDDKHIGLILIDEDFLQAYVEKSSRKLADKVGVFKPGERVQVFGTIHLTETGFVMVVDDIVAG